MDIAKAKQIMQELGCPCVVPLSRTLKFGVAPTDVYAKLREESEHSFLLESAITGEKIARYSFLGNAPEKIVSIKDGELRVNGKRAKNVSDPLEPQRELLSGYKVYTHELPRFFGGLLGYFSYDVVRYFEEIGRSAADDLSQKDAEFMLVRDLIVFDHWREEIVLISNMIIEREQDLEKEVRRASSKLTDLEKVVADSKPRKPRYREGKIEVKSNFTKEAFEEAVERTKEYIRAGDIFQGVISQRFECSAPADPMDVYLALKEINPSPYMYFLEFGGLKIIGSSPEILVRIEDGKVVVRPIAGTRPRGRNAVEDEGLAREMMNDPKERAEHVMLVDLGRNDVGRVSKFGSVVVDEFMAVERYSHVQHLVSNVVGALREDMDAFDALEASFPAGTVSGAPKVRAMQIIEELEPQRRGIYAGAVGYFSFDLQMDFAITIRTIVMQDGKAYVQAGAGIVADSMPEREYQETLNKGRGMLKALELAGGASK